ncbi:hypothetical protein FA13DRAFT_1733789 [Coprinellus micaceus]|uniref:Uncharacterized protein n=1 Tax=Coprinellus micaceus TaxID=71717 RepID=A0A4Y7TA90_COPMI|nr:hypothetical protein FA13DRAFT_1733789 [Coprinellus micaceus]
MSNYAFDSGIAECSFELVLYNSLGQSPCQVGTALSGKPCGANEIVLTPLSLPNSKSYPGPQSDESCRCSSITYNLVSACAVCQGGNAISWNEYRSSCEFKASLGRYPKNIPTGLAIPAWAFMLPTSFNGTFDVTAAGGINAPDALPSDSPQTEPSATSPNLFTSSSITLFSSTSDSTVASGTPTPVTGGPISSRPQSNSAIIGGAVGGAVVIIAMVVGLILWARSRRRTKPPVSPFTNMSTSAGHRTTKQVYSPHHDTDLPPAYAAEDSGDVILDISASSSPMEPPAYPRSAQGPSTQMSELRVPRKPPRR